MPFFRQGVPLRMPAGAVLALVAFLGISFAARADAAGPWKEPADVSRLLPRPTVESSAAPVRMRTAADGAAPSAASVPLAVQVADLNSGSTIERSQCVTVATGLRSAYECGDLRMVHGLPGFRTRNQVRAPVLLYNAQHAHPKPTVYADVTLPAGASVPTTVQAAVVIGGVAVATGSWPGGDWQPGASRRVALQWDGLNTATGLYAYSLQVTAVYGGTQVTSTPATDSLAVVNRQGSYFGAGWWLAGWEELVPNGTGFLWVGGDGSTRAFYPVGTDRWTAFNPSGPRDTLVKWVDPVTAEVQYRRVLRGGGGATHFRANGVHFRTVARLEGFATVFAADGNRLRDITLPVVGGTAPKYRFNYDAENRLANVQAEAPNAPTRVTAVGWFGTGDRRVAGIQDPDGNGVAFAYDAQVTRRIAGYTDRRLTYTSFTFDAAGKVSGTRLWMGATQSSSDILRGFEAGESKGIGSSVATADVYTKLDGARTDVVDHTYLWITRFGAPSRIRDALGNETQIFHESGVYPGLVTRTIAPNGFTQRVEFTGRGIPRRIISTNARGDGKADTLLYVYNSFTWPDLPTTIIPPERDSVTIGYRQDGSRAWQRDALGRTVYFRYYDTAPLKGMLRATDTPETPADSVVYDNALGNLAATRSPMGVWTQYATDPIGQTTDVSAPVDSAGQLGHQYTYYDAMGRDTLVLATGPALPYSLAWAPTGAPAVAAEWTRVQKTYDGEDNVLTVSSYSSVDAGAEVYSAFSYDKAGRKRTELVGQKTTTWDYDPAGNVVSTYTNRNLPTVMEYDAANRMVSRVMPAAAYPAETCGQHGSQFPCTYRFPLYPNGPSGGLTVPGDTATFSYDVSGNLLTANNGAARIRRTYTPGGLLATDSLRIRVYGQGGTSPVCPGSPGCPPEIESVGGGGVEGFDTGIASVIDPYPDTEFTTHIYGLGYRYDRNGRVKDLLGPATISAASGRDSTRYTYNTAGELSGVRDPLGNLFGFVYDNDGRPVRTDYPGGVSETHTYDADGRLTRRRAAGSWLIHDDSIEYDVRGKALRVTEAWGSNVIQNRYSGMGTLLASSYGATAAIPTVEEYRSDPLGHMYWSRTRDPETGRSPGMGYVYAPGGSAVVSKTAVDAHSPEHPWRPDTTYARLDPAGNVRASGHRSYGPTSSGDGGQFTLVAASALQHYYAADEKLRFLQKYDWNSENRNGTFDEYRYDALGRRVLHRMRRDSLCYGAGADCTSATERYVWSGDQLLYEIRAQGGDNATTAAMESDVPSGDEFGRVGYTHAAGIDAPLSVIRTGYVSGNITIIPHSDYRGAYHAGSTSTGAAYNCGPSDPCLYVVFPKQYWGGYWDGGDPAAGDWAGSLIRGQQDISGLMYRRNRYYDPQTGQFTQSDPIGVAGGLNTYGFAAGDPVSYADPFGLMNEYNIYGEEIGKEGGSEQHYLVHEGRRYRLDRPLTTNQNRTPYRIHGQGEAEEIATDMVNAKPAMNRAFAMAQSFSGGELDFKTQGRLANPRQLFLMAGRMMHTDVVGNMAWGFYARTKLNMSLRGALSAAQTVSFGFDDPIDQWAIRRAYTLAAP